MTAAVLLQETARLRALLGEIVDILTDDTPWTLERTQRLDQLVVDAQELLQESCNTKPDHDKPGGITIPASGSATSTEEPKPEPPAVECDNPANNISANVTPTKRCSRCGKSKPRDAFHRRRAAKDGLQAWCKQCVSSRSKKPPTPPTPAPPATQPTDPSPPPAGSRGPVLVEVHCPGCNTTRQERYDGSMATEAVRAVEGAAHVACPGEIELTVRPVPDVVEQPVQLHREPAR